MNNFVYTIKDGDSTSSIAAKFGTTGRENELIAINTQIPKRTVYFAGQPQTVFADLLIGQQIIIPSNWINRQNRTGVGVGASCPPGFTYNVSFQRCMPTSVGTSGVPDSGQCGAPACPPGHRFNPRNGFCIPNNLGTSGVPDSGQCGVSGCPSGWTLNTNTGKCMPPCIQKGFVRDSRGNCVPISQPKIGTSIRGTVGISDSGQCGASGCKPGWTLHNGRCFPPGTNLGTAGVPNSGQCGASSCPPGHRFDPRNGFCIPNGVGVSGTETCGQCGRAVRTCPPGFVKDPSRNMCIPRNSKKALGIRGVGVASPLALGAVEGEACDWSTWCDSGLQCQNGVCVQEVSNPNTTNYDVGEGGYCDNTNWCGTGLQCQGNACVQEVSNPNTTNYDVGEGGYCDTTNMCGSGLTCSDTWNGGTCQSGGINDPDAAARAACVAGGGTWSSVGCAYPADPQTDCANQGGIWDVITATCKTGCYPDVYGCNQDSECCSGYCNTNVPVPDGQFGQCQTPGTHPPLLGSCHYEGDNCGKDSDCCSSNCNNGVCDVYDPGKGIANTEYSCSDPAIITAVQEYLANSYPILLTVGAWGAWGPESTAALAASGRTFTDIYNEISHGNIQCTGNGPGSTYCPSGQDFDLNDGTCKSTTPPPSGITCPSGKTYDQASQSCVAIIPLPKKQPKDVVPVVDNNPPAKTEGGFPWGWVALGTGVAVVGGTVAYYSLKGDKKKPAVAKTATAKPLTTASAMAEPFPRRRYYR